KGIDHVYIRPRTPRLNGKVERSHRIDAEEFYRLLDGQVIDDTRLFTGKLQEWEDYYNYHRPHGALGGQTPYQRLRQKAQDPLSQASVSFTTRPAAIPAATCRAILVTSSCRVLHRLQRGSTARSLHVTIRR